MRTLLLAFTAVFFVACELEKPADPDDAPERAATPKPAPKPGEWMRTNKGALDTATPKPASPSAKPGDWLKNYEGPLDPKKKK